MYDYHLNDGGISHTGKSEDDEDEDKKSFKVTLTACYEFPLFDVASNSHNILGVYLSLVCT